MKMLPKKQARGPRYMPLPITDTRRRDSNKRKSAGIFQNIRRTAATAFNNYVGSDYSDEESQPLGEGEDFGEDNAQTASGDDHPQLHSTHFIHENELNTYGSAKNLGLKPGVSEMANRNGDLAQVSSNCVEMRNVFKSYGSGKRKLDVLTGINMTVPQGAIYGLLGPSGCGKTTLLRCVVGQLKIDAGVINVFGSTPGDRTKGVPGEKCGYMPQEIALYNEFTIKETMNYFGRIHNMPFDDINERKTFLLEFLKLPKESRFVKNLSGGQKRRVSFAVALLHEPSLLILDEPTVGVDPLLRKNIWNHLVTIAKDGNTTIIITTHYIEEARQANVVGLLRGGHILAEASPNTLLSHYRCANLEDVFLKLCVAMDNGEADKALQSQPKRAILAAQKDDRDVMGSSVSVDNEPFHASTEILVNSRPSKVPDYHKKTNKHGCAYKVFSRNKAVAMITKNFIRMWRNVGTMVFQFIIPSIQIILFCLAIGKSPADLDVAVVNNDNDTLRYGALFLDSLSKHTIHQVAYDDLSVALHDVRANEVWSVIYIPFNYSQNLLSRFYGCTDVEDEVLEGSKIRVWLDITSQQIAYTLREEFFRSLQNFSRDRLQTNGLNPDIASLPMEFEDPIYGSSIEDPSFTEFMAPGIILSISYFMAVGLTALAFIIERKEGLLDRTYVAGVNTAEIMIGHFVTQFFVMLVQIGLSLLFMIVVFNVPCRGSPLWVILLTILQGACGMTYGLLISAFCDEEHSAIMFALGSFYCNLLMSGIIWPVQGMPFYMRYVSYVLPQTIPTESMRALLSRGWGIEHPVVWQGFAITFAWLLFFLIIVTVLMRRRR